MSIGSPEDRRTGLSLAGPVVAARLKAMMHALSEPGVSPPKVNRLHCETACYYHPERGPRLVGATGQILNLRVHVQSKRWVPFWNWYLKKTTSEPYTMAA